MGNGSRRFLILHGWENHRPADHWQYWLAERLRCRGEQVLYPQLPSPDDPSLDAWLEVLRTELDMLGTGERIVICHSLACLLWLRHASTAEAHHVVDRVLLVCPPAPSKLPDRLAAFFPVPSDRLGLQRAARRPIELVCTDADPWCPEGATRLFGEPLGLDVHVVPGGGHLSAVEGYGAWPEVERWACEGRFATEPAGDASAVAA